jgi:polysaccharide export outer membrane protein
MQAPGPRIQRDPATVRIIRSAFLLLTALAAGACSEVVPGLNVAKVDEGVHVFGEKESTARGSEWPPYGPRAVPPPPSAVAAAEPAPLGKYEVVRVSPQVVAGLRQQQAASARDAVAGLPVASPADVPPEYRMGPGDVVLVSVWEHPEFSQPVTGGDNNLAEKEGRIVAADGSLYYPVVGTLRAAGLTVRELREVFAQRLEGLVVDPKVDAKVLSYRAHRVQVTGEVRKPGTITLDDTPKGILQAIDASGGLAEGASRRRAVLVRGDQRYSIDIASLLSGEGPGGNVLLQPGDHLHVPDRARDKVYMLGSVKEQQPVIMQDGSIPLVEALSASGGLDTLRGNDSGVLVFRLNDAGSAASASVYALDMSSAEGMLLASQFPLHARDIVYVMATALSQYNTVIEQVFPTVNTVWVGDQIQGIE